MMKDQNLPNKILQSNNNSGKPFLPSYSNSRSQSPYKTIFVENPQLDKYHKLIQQICTVDQTVKKIKTEKTNLDLTLIELPILTTLEINYIPTNIMDYTHVIIPDIPQSIAIEFIQKIAIVIIQIRDLEVS